MAKINLKPALLVLWSYCVKVKIHFIQKIHASIQLCKSTIFNLEECAPNITGPQATQCLNHR